MQRTNQCVDAYALSAVRRSLSSRFAVLTRPAQARQCGWLALATLG